MRIWQYDIEHAFNKSVLHGIFNTVVSLNYNYTNFIAAVFVSTLAALVVYEFIKNKIVSMKE